VRKCNIQARPAACSAATGSGPVLEPGARAVGQVRTQNGVSPHSDVSASGLFWLVGWLFTIGILHLPFWKAVLAIVAWPYYLGAALEPLLR
jgi:hypothetical protein